MVSKTIKKHQSHSNGVSICVRYACSNV